MTTALIVDDSRLSRMMVQAAIKEIRPEWLTIEASNSDDALNKTQEQQSVDVIILDYNMPGENGITLGVELQQRYPNAFVSMLTANIQESTQRKAHDAGFTFFKKPVTKELVTEIIETSGKS